MINPNLLAEEIKIAPEGGFKGFGPLGNITSKTGSLTTFSNFISTAIGIMTIIAFIWFIFNFFTGVISIIGSGGDKQGMETAKKKITSSLLGLVVTIAAIFIISLIGVIFGVDFLSFSALFDQVSGLLIQTQ